MQTKQKTKVKISRHKITSKSKDNNLEWGAFYALQLLNSLYNNFEITSNSTSFSIFILLFFSNFQLLGWQLPSILLSAWEKHMQLVQTLITGWPIALTKKSHKASIEKTDLLHTTHVCTFSCRNTSICCELWASIHWFHTNNSNWIDFNLKY